MMHTIGVTSNGITVNVDLVRSGAAQLIARRPHFLSLASEIVGKIELNDSSMTMTYNMGRPIGYDFVVEPATADIVFYAQPAKEEVYIPFTKKGTPASTNLLTMVLSHSETDGYYLDDMWTGPFRPGLPGTEAATEESIDYWKSHAYIFEDQHIKSSSITHDCPY